MQHTQRINTVRVGFLLGLLLLGLADCKRAVVIPGSKSTDSSIPTRDNNLTLGNPSAAATTDRNNYLIDKGTYAVSYNASRGGPNWSGWHLSTAWKGSASRSNLFMPEPAIPAGAYRVTTGDYTNTGFDRGHLCPSDDRDATAAENQSTFYLSNVVPQAPACNRQSWRLLEEYTRSLLAAGNECYVVAGSWGQGGTGDKGTVQTLAAGRLTVPSALWKVIVVLPVGNNDAERVSTQTRVIAVWMPNTNAVGSDKWTAYRVSVDEIEARTGYDLLSNVAKDVQRVIEARVDGVVP